MYLIALMIFDVQCYQKCPVVHCHTFVSEILTISFNIHMIYRVYEEIQLHTQQPQTLPTQKCEAYGFLEKIPTTPNNVADVATEDHVYERVS